MVNKFKIKALTSIMAINEADLYPEKSTPIMAPSARIWQSTVINSQQPVYITGRVTNNTTSCSMANACHSAAVRMMAPSPSNNSEGIRR